MNLEKCLDMLVSNLKNESDEFKDFFEKMEKIENQTGKHLTHLSRFLSATLGKVSDNISEDKKGDYLRIAGIVLDNLEKTLTSCDEVFRGVIRDELFGHLSHFTFYWDEIYVLAGLETKKIMDIVGSDSRKYLEMKREWRTEDKGEE